MANAPTRPPNDVSSHGLHPDLSAVLASSKVMNSRLFASHAGDETTLWTKPGSHASIAAMPLGAVGPSGSSVQPPWSWVSWPSWQVSGSMKEKAGSDAGLLRSF